MSNTVIGIAGGTGSGKTTLAERIMGHFPDRSIALIHQDSYYRDLSRLSPVEREGVNFDHPDAIDNELLAEQIRRLKDGRSIEKPVYDFRSHTRKGAPVVVGPCEVILLEGILIFEEAGLRELMDIKIFVDTDPDIRFIRRLERDMKTRARTLDSVIEQYLSTVRPMHFEFVEKSKRFADLIIPEGGQNDIAIRMIASRIESILAGRGEVPR